MAKSEDYSDTKCEQSRLVSPSDIEHCLQYVSLCDVCLDHVLASWPACSSHFVCVIRHFVPWFDPHVAACTRWHVDFCPPPLGWCMSRCRPWRTS